MSLYFLGDSMGGHRGQTFTAKIKTSTHPVRIVQRRINVLCGMQVVTVQTWMACTRKENISRLPMESTNLLGKGTITQWKGQQWWLEENRILNINK